MLPLVKNKLCNELLRNFLIKIIYRITCSEKIIIHNVTINININCLSGMNFLVVGLK